MCRVDHSADDIVAKSNKFLLGDECAEARQPEILIYTDPLDGTLPVTHGQ